ncbi:carbamate kinase family protein [Paenibacillus sp. CMAA1364]
MAIGGNSLVKSNGRESVEDQYEAVCEIAIHIADMVQDGHELVVTHGNGPQVGFALRRSEVAHEIIGLHAVPLVHCVADTQGGIGYLIQQALTNEFITRGLDKKVVTIITQVEVSKDDSNLLHPTKPVGSFYTLEQADEIRLEHPDWVMIEDSGRGYRRVVPSPKPIHIVEKDVIKSLIESGYVVIAVGGGGIPVVRNEKKTYQGIDAVIDKDLASSLLADQIDADGLIITTAVPNVYTNFGQTNQMALEIVTTETMKRYIQEGHFPRGSMLPKIEASLSFLNKKDRIVIITSPDRLKDAMNNNGGTHIVNW